MAFSFTGFLKGLLIQNEVDRTKQVIIQSSASSTTGTSTTITTAQTANRILTMPDATDTLTGNTATQTLTNKTLNSTNTATGINMASFTPDNGVHTLTAPIITDTLTTNTATQTLTNKSISGTTNTLTNLPGSAITGTVAIANGGTGQVSQQAAINALAGAVVSGEYLRGNGTNVVMSTIQASDVPILNQNTTGTAANITATSNSTLTTLSALSLPGSQVAGNISGDATNVTGTVTVANGGTGLNSTPAYAVLAGGVTSTSALQNVGSGTTGQVLTSTGNNSLPTWQSVSGGGSKNYLSAYIASTSGGLANSGNGNAELGSTSGWNMGFIGTLTNGLPTGTPAFSTNPNVYVFTLSGSSNAGLGSVYTNNGQTFTVLQAISAGTTLIAAGTGDPLSNSTLTFVSGSPSGNINYIAFSSEKLAITSSGQLAGDFSFQLHATSIQSTGLMLASNTFFIDAEDQGKVLTTKLYYSPTVNASSMNFSGTSANSWAWAVWDVTNSQWLGTTGQFGFTQSSGSGYVTGTFQTAINTSQLVFCIYNPNAFSGASTVLFDDISVGPQTAPIGPAMTDWIAYTPTFMGFGTPTSISFFSRRVGDTLEVQGKFISGSPTATTAQITLGYAGSNGNVTIDTTKTAAINAGFGSINIGTTTYFGIAPINPNSAVNYFEIGVQSSTSTQQTPQNGSGIVSSGNVVSIFLEVPITGWSSNVQMSNDTDTRVIGFDAPQQTPTGTITSVNNVIKFGTVGRDDANRYSTSTGLYTANVTGWYQISCIVEFLFSPSANGNWLRVGLYKNALASAFSAGVYTAQSTAASQPAVVSVTGLVYLNAGDYIAPYSFLNGGSASFNTSTSGSYLNINRISGPAVIAATESVNAFYDTSSGQSIPNSIETTVIFNNKIYDSHNALNTSNGLYTCPISGKYRITSMITFASFASGTNLRLNSYHNGAGTQVFWLGGFSVAQSNSGLAGSITINCLAGDTIGMQVWQNSGTSISLYSSGGDPTENWMAIERVGN